MVTRSNIKVGLTGALLLIILGAFAACGELPTAQSGGGDYDCVMIDGIIHCRPST